MAGAAAVPGEIGASCCYLYEEICESGIGELIKQLVSDAEMLLVVIVANGWQQAGGSGK